MIDHRGWSPRLLGRLTSGPAGPAHGHDVCILTASGTGGPEEAVVNHLSR
jgi:hypothetical protein